MRISRTACAALLLACVAAGCSSDHPTATKNPSTTNATTRSATPEQAAIALADKMLNDAVVPAGKVRSAAGLPDSLQAPYQLPYTKQIVQAHRVWSVPAKLADVAGFLHANTPRGYTSNSGGVLTVGGVKTYFYDQQPRVLPPNVSSAQLQLSVAADGPNAVFVRADATVGWTRPRPADEFVPATDRVVIVSVIHEFQPGKPLGKRVVLTDARVVQPIVRAFNRLRVAAPPTIVHGCPPMGPRTVSYRIAFAASPTSAPDIVASIGKCSDVGVSVHGRSAPALGDFINADFANAVAHVLGLAEPHLG